MTWAKRDEGRPALAGAATGADATGAGATLDFAGEEDTTDGIGTGLAASLTAGLGAEIGWACTTAFAGGFETGLLGATEAGFAACFCTTFGSALVDDLSATLADGLTTTFTVGLLGAAFTAGLAGFAIALPAGLGTGLAADLTVAFATGVAALVTIALPGFDFTSCLLAGLACACSADTERPLRPLEGLSAGLSSARECTGSRLGKPISCKSETIIGLPNLVSFNVKKWHCAAVR